MSAGLCSVLKSIRGSMESDSDSENDHDVTDDVDPPSWHGSMQHLTSTSESEAGNCSSESFLCDHCGRPPTKGDNNSSNNSNHSRTSGRPPFPAGRKRGVRPKKRAHFAVDTDNSSDNADKMSDSHDSSPCSTSFKPISGPPQLMFSTSRRGSLSPREVKHTPSLDSHTNRPSPSFTRSTSLSTSSDRGRQPFKASHELFKLPPSGCSISSASGKPALPPRQINRNHFKLQRRNSVSNDERSKLPLQTIPGKSDAKPVRSASATREIGSKNLETNGTDFQTKMSEPRVTFSLSKSDVVPSRDRSEFSDGHMKGSANVRELPNYDEAVQRVSLLRWASLQKIPTKSSSCDKLICPPTKDFSPIKDFSPTSDISPTSEFKRFPGNPQIITSTNSSPVSSGHVGDRVRCFEAKAVSFSSGSNSSSVAAERSSNSLNPTTSVGSVNSKSDWLRNGGNIHVHNSKVNDYSGHNLGINVINYTQRSSNSSMNHTDYHTDTGSVFRLRRDDSSTLSDDVFANDDTRDNFADISWSPVILSEDRNAENSFPSVPPLRPPKPSTIATFLAPPLPPSHANRSRIDSNVAIGLMQPGNHDRHSNNIINNNNSARSNSNNVAIQNKVASDNSNSKKSNLGDNSSSNPPSIPNGKHIVLEVLV